MMLSASTWLRLRAHARRRSKHAQTTEVALSACPMWRLAQGPDEQDHAHDQRQHSYKIDERAERGGFGAQRPH